MNTVLKTELGHFSWQLIFRKLMYRSGDPFTIPLELCYITKRETSKAQFCIAICHF